MGMGSGRSYCCSCLPRLFFSVRALAVVGLFCLLVIGRSLGSDVPATTLSSSSEKLLKHDDDFAFLGRTKSDHKQHVNQQELDLTYMSKRRVPNGPDPIHNRFVIFLCVFVFFWKLLLYDVSISYVLLLISTHNTLSQNRISLLVPWSLTLIIIYLCLILYGVFF